MAISIFHIGLPLDHPTIPAEDRSRIAERLRNITQSMRAAGYDYEIVHASPEEGLASFEQLLRARPCDGVLIGGAVSGDPIMRPFMEQIMRITRELAPQAKIMFFSHAENVRTTVERCFKES